MTNIKTSNVVAGVGSVMILQPATEVFKAGGNQVLCKSTQQGLKAAVEEIGQHGIRTFAGEVVHEGVSELSTDLFQQVLSTGSRQLVRKGGAEIARKGGARVAQQVSTRVLIESGKTLARGVGTAAGAGGLIDGVCALPHAVRSYASGEMDGAQAVGHVAKESAKGAAASGVGVLLAAGAVALSGPLAPVTLFGLGVLGSVVTKASLDAIFD